MTNVSEDVPPSVDSPRRSLRCLNLACGTRMHSDWINADFSQYAKLAKHPRLARFLYFIRLLSADRYRRLQSVDPNILCINLLKGLPFPSDHFDVVYHSHFLEHLDRSAVPKFLTECRRVLKPGGVLRISLPDLHKLASWYLASNSRLCKETSPAEMESHLRHIDALFDQMVREETSGASNQIAIVRWIERILGHSAKNMGELHKWMYDYYSLKAVLEKVGFHSVNEHSATTSAVPDWSRFDLDTNPDGSVYKPESLFVEALK